MSKTKPGKPLKPDHKPHKAPKPPRRDADGRFEPATRGRNIAIGAAAAVGAVASAVGAALHFGLFDRFFRVREGHAAPDLAAGKPRPGAHDRAPDAFRPDPTAPVPASEREALRPATGPSPSMVADRGEMRSQTGASN